MKIVTKSAKETQDFAQKLAEEFKDGGIIAMSGDLGTGKTTFAQGFAKGLNIQDKIISPTFLIIRQYPIPSKKNIFYHIDLYRLEGIDLKSSGLEEILLDSTNIVLIEWAEKLGNNLPKESKEINLRIISEETHEIEVADKD